MSGVQPVRTFTFISHQNIPFHFFLINNILKNVNTRITGFFQVYSVSLIYIYIYIYIIIQYIHAHTHIYIQVYIIYI